MSQQKQENCPECGQPLELNLIAEQRKYYFQDKNGAWVLYDSDNNKQEFLQCDNCGYDKEVIKQ